jgi:hypothetical protein
MEAPNGGDPASSGKHPIGKAAQGKGRSEALASTLAKTPSLERLEEIDTMTNIRMSIYKTRAAFKGMMLFGGTAAALGLMPLRADILGVSGNPSVPANQPPLILQTPPSDVTNQCVTNQAQWGFNEKQQVTTTQDWTVDGGGKIPKGTTFVNSHMIFMNQPSTATGSLSQTATWTFDFPIIGVMSDTGGQLEANSTPDFGAPATNYSMRAQEQPTIR